MMLLTFFLIIIDVCVCLLTCLLAYFVPCVAGRVASRTSHLQDVLSCVAVTASLRDIWVSLTMWSAQRSGGRTLGRCHVEGGVEARMSMA